ncbi:metallophosphoesterase family protein [Neobacillus mesonae]|nr:metallophosphoesterase family protein [Neobacillus mesonae]
MKIKDTMWIIILAIAVVVGVIGIQWLFQTRSVTTQTPLVVTTMKGDPATSRAFTWQGSSTSASAQVQILEGKSTHFDKDDVINIEGSTSVIKQGGQKTAVHKAEATGLKPGTLYSYRAGDGTEEGWSSVRTFVTAKNKESDFSFIYVTDSQGETESDFALWENTMNQAMARYASPAFVLHAGDFVEDADNTSAWSSFFNTSASWISQTPIVPVIGNNDVIDDSFDPFASYFNLPENGVKALDGTGTNYSFDYGNLHISVLNTEGSIKKQTEWLEKDLAGTDQEWKIVALHRPIYGGNMYKKIQDWSEVIDKYEVDLVLQGHNHEYSRSYPIKDGKVTGNSSDTVQNQEGTVYVVANTSGPKFNEQKDEQFYHKVHFQNYKQMYTGISISGKTLTYQAYDVDGQLLDKFTINH